MCDDAPAERNDRAAGGSDAAGEGGDRYTVFLASEEYRQGRLRKARVIASLCREELAAADQVADVGAGTGIIKNALEVEFSKSIVGFDIDYAFIIERDRMVAADASRLPVRPESFDLVLLNHIYEHVADQPALFREAHRILKPGGVAYVSAGNRLAIMEPHYRLPFLSWLPNPVADRYVRWTRRGSGYEDIRFLTYRPLRKMIEAVGLRLRDVTERAIDEQLGETWGAAWVPAWKVFRAMPASIRGALMAGLSPQWFLLLEKPHRDTEMIEGS